VPWQYLLSYSSKNTLIPDLFPDVAFETSIKAEHLSSWFKVCKVSSRDCGAGYNGNKMHP